MLVTHLVASSLLIVGRVAKIGAGKKMAGIDLAAVRAELTATGYAVTNGTLTQIERAIQLENALFRANSTEQKRAAKRLRPYTVEEAPPRSLSAVYGLGAQPLHTDGAHLLNPPDVIVLYAEAPTSTGTLVNRPAYNVPEAVREGIFTVRGNGMSFLTTAYEGYKFRFDPVTMSPGDALARDAVKWFEDQRQNSLLHTWDQEHQLLFIDNRRALHAREAVTDDADTRVLGRLSLSYVEES
jgi:alpha-ketoglutarate-dependent taurine dioxygenase